MQEKLVYKKKTVYELCSNEVIEAAYEYAKGYVEYLDASKTEREAVVSAIALAEKNGFKEYVLGAPISVGDKFYFNNRGKNLFLFSIGTEHINNGIRISASHIDSPRIDLKPCPLYEADGMSFFKTHYYGGIRKYQWMALPLALHGVVIKADGSRVNIAIGDSEDDPIFYINDLLPHLGRATNSKTVADAFPAENLNVLVGSRPVDGEEGSDLIKLNVLKILNDKYGITEEDFLSAELCCVPAANARDIGFDRSLIGAYGHDDKVCAYPSMSAIFENAGGEHTLMCILADKEETGSEGSTGMKNSLMNDLIDIIANALGGTPSIVRANSKCLSADVSAAYDPNFSQVFEKRNSALLNCGVILMKYTGSGGKSGTSDASAEYIGWLRQVMAKDGVIWQTGELGKVDIGGGGTVAKFIAEYNIDTVDLGVPVISMHAPCEVISKVDLYETYRAFSAFCKY